MPNDGMKFDDIFKTANIALRIIGSHPARSRDKTWKVQFLILIMLNIFCSGLLSYSIFIKDVQDERYADASKNSMMLIVTVTVVFKYSILLVHQQTILGLINTINDDYKVISQMSDEEKKIVQNYSEKGVKVCRIWYIVSIISSMIFPVKAILLMAYIYYKKGKFQLVPMFDLSYPDAVEVNKNDPSLYFILLAIYGLFALYAGTTYTGFDPLVPIFLLHLCGQLEVVSQRILKLYAITSDEEEVEEKFKSIILKLQEIYRFVDTVKIDFTILYEFTMKTTTFLMPLCAFQIYVSLHNRDSNLEFIPFFFGVLLHFYIPCYYSDLLMEKSEKLRQAIYSCGWELQTNLRTRKTVLIMLTRATRPLVIHSVFYPVCLDTFSKMARTAYAIFNIMTASVQTVTI